VIPILEDNYVFVVYDEITKRACVIDPGSALEVELFLRENNLELDLILITHKHHDHIGGISELLSSHPECKVYSSSLNKSFLNYIDYFVGENDTIPFCDTQFSVIELPGHTMDHIAFYLKDQKWLFSGDVLFGLGCGRVFEGTMEQAYHSLQKVKLYPKETFVFCTHEYTQSNLEFCKIHFPSIELDQFSLVLENLIKLKMPTVPLSLEKEHLMNPFLTAKSVQEFTQRRQLRNQW
jgi:hydroxyacylglutathione hydrolase